MKLRAYQSGDLPAILNLFRDTVHTVCARGYTRAQLDAWAPAELDAAAWDASLLAHQTLVAEENGSIIGFADLAEDGYLDRLYVHRDWQGRGGGLRPVRRPARRPAHPRLPHRKALL